MAANGKLLALLGAGAAYLINRQMKNRSSNGNLWAEATNGGAGSTNDLRFDNDSKGNLDFSNGKEPLRFDK